MSHGIDELHKLLGYLLAISFSFAYACRRVGGGILEQSALESRSQWYV
ncbi:MAG: hypothetical protein AAGA67_03510 [Cyanobacteria bacterium P01_F01_bin.153]